MNQLRLANNASDLWQKFILLSKSGKVAPNGEILHPVAFVPLLGYIIYDITQHQYRLMADFGMTSIELIKQQHNALYAAIEADQVNIDLMTGWGGAGNYNERMRRPVQRLHTGHGLNWIMQKNVTTIT